MVFSSTMIYRVTDYFLSKGAKTMQTLEKIMGAILIAGLAYTFITMVFLAIAIVIKNSV
jgi:hypothetical protein